MDNDRANVVKVFTFYGHFQTYILPPYVNKILIIEKMKT